MPIINEGYELVPIDTLEPHPENPRQGDIGAVVASIEAHGFYGSLLVQRSTNRVVVGNHRLLAAQESGIEAVPVIFLDVDDEEARRIMLVDNRLSDLAAYDDHALAELLASLASGDGLDGTGYDGDDLDRLLADLDEPFNPEEPADGEGSGGRGPRSSPEWHATCPECGTQFRLGPDDVA